jgi:hypothetical protein
MLRKATEKDTAAIVALLVEAKQGSPYADLPLHRGAITRMVARLVAGGCCWVRTRGRHTVACAIGQLADNLYGYRVLSVHAVVGGGGFWLLRKLVEQAREANATGVWMGTSLASDDEQFSGLAEALGGSRTGSTYEVQTWQQQFLQ